MLSQLFLVVTPWFCSAVDKFHFLSQICKVRLPLKKWSRSCGCAGRALKAALGDGSLVAAAAASRD